ncbi:MAG: ornithine cyclodeaminase family protein [Lachnospiraceae bacterium]|nr:ornithine cyclodeaminase family protein [Lachnospiraceae bacterium]
MIILNEKEMWTAVALDEVLDAVEDAFAIHRGGNYLMPDRHVVEEKGDKLMFMPCFLDSVISTKMLAEFPENPGKGKPLLSGLVILNDRRDGQVTAILNGGELTAMRTGAVGGVAIKYLAPKEAKTVGLAGCGVQGFTQLLYACHVRDIKEVRLYDAFKKDYTDFVKRLKDRIPRKDIEFIVCRDAKELAEKSEILITATQTKEPIFPDDMELLKGKTFISIGSWIPDRRELPMAVSKLVNTVYADLPYAKEESGDLKIPLDEGILTHDRVKYIEDLIADVKAGKPHELSETRWFKTVGMGIFDARVGQLLYEKALERGIGTKVDF